MSRDAGQTRANILAAADELFYSEGVRNIGVDEIARKAGITKRRSTITSAARTS